MSKEDWVILRLIATFVRVCPVSAERDLTVRKAITFMHDKHGRQAVSRAVHDLVLERMLGKQP